MSDPAINSPKQRDVLAPAADDALARLMPLAPVLVLLLDRQQRIVHASRFAEEFIGAHWAELAGADWCDALLAPQDRAAGRQMLAAVLEGTTVGAVVLPLATRGNARPAIAWSGRLLAGGAGDDAVVLVGLDVSELVRQQAMELESGRLSAIGQMAAGLAHEGRNALQQIGACSEMMAMELKGLPEALDLVAGVQEAEARLQRLFEETQAYAIRPALELRPGDISDVWRSAWSAAVALHPGRQLRLVEHVDPGTVELEIARAALQRAFVHVFENAMDACRDPATIELLCWTDEIGGRRALAISVRDTGPGFTRESLARAFEPYYSTKTQGTGLGLPIARHVVESHGGEVRAENAAEGGALVQFLLPQER